MTGVRTLTDKRSISERSYRATSSLYSVVMVCPSNSCKRSVLLNRAGGPN